MRSEVRVGGSKVCSEMLSAARVSRRSVCERRCSTAVDALAHCDGLSSVQFSSV